MIVALVHATAAHAVLATATIFDDDFVPPPSTIAPADLGSGHAADPAKSSPDPSVSPPPTTEKPDGASNPSAGDAPQTRPARLALPSAADQKKAEKSIRDLFRADYARHSSADRTLLAQKLAAQAETVTSDPAEQYVMLREARDLATQAGSPLVALLAVQQMSRHFATDGGRSDVLAKLNKAAQAPAQRLELARSCAAVLDDTRTLGKYESLNQLAPIAESIALNCPSAVVAAKLRRQARDGRALRAEFDRAAAAAIKLKQNPSDSASAQSEGLFLTLVHGDWANGLPLLIRSPDARIKAAATRDVANPTSPEDEIAAGDGWVMLSKSEQPVLKTACEERANYWYSKAVGDSSDLTKQKAIQKLESLPGHLPFSAIAAAVAAKQVVKTAKVGGGGGGEFDDIPADGAILIGFTTTEVEYYGSMVVGSLRPIWRTAAGRLVGTVHGPGGNHESTVEAEEGYAVGAINVKGGDRLDGFQFVFMRIKANSAGLDPSDSYASDWVGGKGGSKPVVLSGDGKFIVGFFGFTGNGFDSAGLVKLP